MDEKRTADEPGGKDHAAWLSRAPSGRCSVISGTRCVSSGTLVLDRRGARVVARHWRQYGGVNGRRCRAPLAAGFCRSCSHRPVHIGPAHEGYAGLCRVAPGCQGLAGSEFGVLDADRARAARPSSIY